MQCSEGERERVRERETQRETARDSERQRETWKPRCLGNGAERKVDLRR